MYLKIDKQVPDVDIEMLDKDWPKWDKHDVIIASNDGLMLTVHSQTSHPLDTILRSKLLCANSIGIPSCIASTRMRTKVSILTLISIEVQRSGTKRCCYWFTLIVYCV